MKTNLLTIKKIAVFVTFILFNHLWTNAQNTINVIITGTLESIGGIYTLNGLENGKNKYTKTSVLNGSAITTNVVLRVTPQLTVWVLEDNEPDAGGDKEVGFYNPNVIDGLLPPLTGWIIAPDPDLNGTMMIEDPLSSDGFNISENILSFYPNPAVYYFMIKNGVNELGTFKYEILDLSGRLIKFGNGNPNEKIIVENLHSGNYIVQVVDEYGKITQQKLIKQ